MTVIVTLEDKLRCVTRELAMRKSAYPRWIEAKKVSAGKAALEIAIMEAIVRDYEEKTRHETVGDLQAE